jgi:hypothetical protein
VSPSSSARSTSKRAIGTARSSSERMVSAPSRCTTSAGSDPGGSRTIRNSTARPARARFTSRSEAIERETASWPAASGSWQKSAVGARRASASTWRSVSDVPIEPTTSATPACRSATASV